MIRYHDVGQFTTAELERARRELRANLGLLRPDSPAEVPIQAQMHVIETELSRRPGNHDAGMSEQHDT